MVLSNYESSLMNRKMKRLTILENISIYITSMYMETTRLNIDFYYSISDVKNSSRTNLRTIALKVTIMNVYVHCTTN